MSGQDDARVLTDALKDWTAERLRRGDDPNILMPQVREEAAALDRLIARCEEAEQERDYFSNRLGDFSAAEQASFARAEAAEALLAKCRGALQTAKDDFGRIQFCLEEKLSGEASSIAYDARYRCDIALAKLSEAENLHVYSDAHSLWLQHVVQELAAEVNELQRILAR